MTEFLKNFDGAKEKAQESHAKTRTVIVELLKHIANSIAHTERLDQDAPSRAEAQQAQKEHDFKNSALQAAKDTHERLQAELRKRRGELDKINGLDTKIRDELKSLAAKMQKMKQELVRRDSLHMASCACLRGLPLFLPTYSVSLNLLLCTRICLM